MAKKYDQRRLGSTELTIARILIAFYFIAVSVGLADGVSLAPLFGTILDDLMAHYASSALLFSMGFLVLMGTAIRGVALMTAGLLIATYIVTAASTGDWVLPKTIWRDVALIGALVLTYAQPPLRKVAKVQTKPVTRADRGGLSKAEEEAMLAHVPGLGIAERKKAIPARHQRPVLQEVFRDQPAG